MNNDLISRKALIQHAYSAVVDGVEKDIIDLSDVDNAPTVEALKDITEVHCDITKEQLLNSLIPQGEWVTGYTTKHKKVAVCNQCNCISVQGKTNFCHNCGAKMQKGGAE